MIQLSSKNDDSSLCYDVIITHQKFYKFGDFANDIDFNSRIDVFRDVIYLDLFFHLLKNKSHSDNFHNF